jgi:hypothetical protein
MLFASENLSLWELLIMTDEERQGIQLRTNTSFTWQQVRWGLVLIFCFVSGGFQIKGWITTYAIQQTATSSATTAMGAAEDIAQIKKDLAVAKAELKQYKLALDSWNDFFIDEESKQTPSARRRYREQRVKIREILKPVSQANPLAGGDGPAAARN